MKGWILFLCMYIPHFVYPFIYPWTLVLLPLFGYYEQCSYKHGCGSIHWRCLWIHNNVNSSSSDGRWETPAWGWVRLQSWELVLGSSLVAGRLGWGPGERVGRYPCTEAELWTERMTVSLRQRLSCSFPLRAILGHPSYLATNLKASSPTVGGEGTKNRTFHLACLVGLHF